MDSIRDYVRTALNGIRQRFNKLEKDFDKKLENKMDLDTLPPQTQSDWNESNEESAAYIHNRPFYEIATPVTFYETDSAPTSG